MGLLPYINRRAFLGRIGALAAVDGARWPRLFAAGLPVAAAGEARLSNRVRDTRPRRYLPERDAFAIRNGEEMFNRPLYGAQRVAANGFRVDAGDRPQMSLYLPGHGGNLRLGITRAGHTRWLDEMAEVVARFRAGYVRYEMRDAGTLGRGGALRMEVQTAGQAAGLQVLLQCEGVPRDARLIWAFGGASGRRFESGGDVGCESVPVREMFRFRPEDCAANRYVLERAGATLESPAGRLHLRFPEAASLHVAPAAAWEGGWPALEKAAEEGDDDVVLAGSVPTEAQTELYLSVAVVGPAGGEDAAAPSFAMNSRQSFEGRRAQLEVLAGSLRLETPDAAMAPAVGALLMATEALWNADDRVMMAGGVAERRATPGWRGPYALDAVGRHDQMRDHLRFWLARQNQEPLPADLNGDEEMRAAADAGSHLSRKEGLLHTNGDVARGHQDWNLLFFDGLVRHLRWTGDATFAREVWPALLRHMDWQYRLFRRVFANPDRHAPRERQMLPLYEAYACAPGSENLQGNGGGAAQATAYNYFLNRATAAIARLLNEDPVPFDEEAALLKEAVMRLLWMEERGAMAEAKDSATPQTIFPRPALWTVSRMLDAEMPTPREAWQMCTERLAEMPRIELDATEVAAGSFLLASSDWMLTEPSLNRISMAEGVHFALALWQAGLADEAYGLLRGNLLDSLYQGLCPGNFHVTSALDPHRGETQRDASDPLGITARALIEGLFGVMPDLMRSTLTLRPGFPTDWTEARLQHPEMDIEWRRDGMRETFTIRSRLPQPVALTLLLPARATSEPVVLSNGKAYPFAFDPDATGRPRLVLTNFPPATAWEIDVRWRGKPPIAVPERATYTVGETIALPAPLTPGQIDDPQMCLSGGVANRVGRHAVFVHVVEEKCGYWLPIPIEIVPRVAPLSSLPVAEQYTPVEMESLLDGCVTDLLRRSYAAPRSAFCSLALPEHLLGGWHDDDRRFEMDDAGLRAAGGVLKTAFDLPFVTPSDRGKGNCRFVSFWEQDKPSVTIPLAGKAHTLYLLMTGTTFPQATGVEHGGVLVSYADGSVSRLPLVTPETWWPVEQDYRTNEMLFRIEAGRPLPPRVDLRTGKTRLLDRDGLAASNGTTPGGAATVLHLPLHAERELVSVRVECSLYGVVVALLGITLGR